VKVEVLGRSLANHKENVIGYNILLAQAQENNSPHSPSDPFPVDTTTVQGSEVNLSWSGGDQDSDAVIYNVYLEAADATPDVLVSDDQTGLAYDTGALPPNTHYYWRIIAKDEHDATTAGPVWEFTTATGDTCPIDLTLQPPQVSDHTAKVEGSVSSGCSTITRLNWQWGDGVSSDQWFPASHTYAGSGTYLVTVTAYNNLGNTEVATTTVQIGAPSSEMVTVPSGVFQMGCDDGNPNEYCYTDEQPLHAVSLGSYAIDKYEVINTQYAEFLNAEGNLEEGGDTWLDADASDVRIHQISGVWQVEAGYENHPVVEVTWYGARAYCQWQGKRLPTEAEWEKAARGSNDTRMYPWGDEDAACSRLNYNYCVDATASVGSYPSGASVYGVMDIAGNVHEWINDWYQSDYYASSPYSNPTGPSSGTEKILRGGSWDHDWYGVRIANRDYNFPDSSSHTIGFRCVDDG
jgi:formylglycine-generating enzyme required for sulfatase activity